MKKQPLRPLTLLQHTLLTALRANGRLTLIQCWSYAEALDPAASQAVIAKRTAAALERLAKEQVIGLHHDPAEGLTGAEAINTLPAASWACVLLSKPPLDKPHALSIQGQSQHVSGRAAIPDQPKAHSRGLEAVDAGGIHGGDSQTGNAGTAAASAGEAAEPVLEVVKIVDPEARP